MWSPKLYNKFKAEHFASFGDLLNLVTKKPDLKVLDLGCGTGELTRTLADSLPNSDVLGIDASPEMLRESSAFSRSKLRFELMSIQEVAKLKRAWDLVFSHTVLHWVDEHHSILPKIISKIARGGQLVVEVVVPDAFFMKTDLDALARTEPFRTTLRGWTWSTSVLRSHEYATLLYNNGGTNIACFEKVYPDMLPDAEAVFDYAAGTAMIAYMKRLPQEEQRSFKEAYKKMLREKYPEKPVFFPYTRIFMAATF